MWLVGCLPKRWAYQLVELERNVSTNIPSTERDAHEQNVLIQASSIGHLANAWHVVLGSARQIRSLA